MAGPQTANKKGMFENTALRQMEKDYLKGLGCDPMGQNPLPDIKKLKPIDIGPKVRAVLYEEGYTGGTWMYKSPKAPLFWTTWYKTCPNARWIICRRDRDDIVNSLLKTRFMHAFKDRDGWEGWIKHHEDRFDEMHEAGLDIREIWTKKIIAGDYSEIKEAVEYCGLKWDEGKVRDFVSPELYHLNGVLAHGKQG